MFYEPRNGHGLPLDPFKAIVAPRPIGWISTLDARGPAEPRAVQLLQRGAFAPADGDVHQ